MRPRLTWIILALLCPLVLAAYLLLGRGDAMRLVLHLGLSHLCHGVSAGKVIFLLIFSGFGFALLAARREPRAHSLRPLWCVLGVGLCASLLSLVLYVRAVGVPLGTPTIHWKDGLNSFNSLTHIHTSKSALAHALTLLGHERLLTKFDTGAPYMSLVPAWLAWTILACFLANLVLALRAMPMLVARYPSRQRVGVAISLALAASACVKCVLDGGPLAYDAVLGIITIATIARCVAVEEMPNRLRHWLIPLTLALGIWMGICLWFAPGSAWHQARWFVVRGAILALPLVLAALLGSNVGQARSWRARPAHATLAILLLLLTLHGIDHASARLLPLLRPAPQTAIVWNARDAALVDVERHSTIARAYASLGDDPLRVRRVSFHDDATPSTRTGMYASVWLRNTSGPAAALALSNTGMVRRSQPAGRHGEWRTHYVQIAFEGRAAPHLAPGQGSGMSALLENERYVALHAFDAALRSQGIDQYVIVPYAMYEDDLSERQATLTDSSRTTP